METERNFNEDARRFPGVAEDAGENEKATPDEVKRDVKNLNNNPRNSDDEMP